MAQPLWHLQLSETASENGGIILCHENEPMSNAKDQPLGLILEVCTPKKGKYSCEGITFKCENGKVFLPLKTHNTSKGTVSRRFEKTSSTTDFIKVWKEMSKKNLSTTPTLPTRAVIPKRPLVDTTSNKSLSNNSPSSLPNNLPLTSAPLAKRCKYIKEDIDESIERCRSGIMELPVSIIHQPPKDSRLLREPDSLFISNLKKKMIEDPSAPGAAPLAVLCKDKQDIDKFDIKHKNVYSYEVLGGLHTLIAKSQLVAEYPENPFFKSCMAEVYIGLNDEEALRLSQRHNLTSHFVHEVTHRDLVEACRARLYKMASQDMKSGPTPKSTATWRESCIKAIIPQDVSKTHKDAIFSQACLSKPVWILAVQVMDLFQEAKLKGQKLKLSTLLSKPDFKQQYLAPIRTLEEPGQCLLLQKIIDRELSIHELKEAAAEMKTMAALKQCFLKLVNIDSWEEAEDKLPQFARLEQLKKFSKFNISQGIPQSFQEFCTRAKQSQSPIALESMDATHICLDDAHCYVIESKFTEMCGSKIANIYTSFNGAHLIITSLSEEITCEGVSSLAYTIREINSATNCKMFTSVAICQPSQMLMVQEAWTKAFVTTDLMFFADCDMKQGNGSGVLIPCVMIVIFGFFAPMSNTITKEHFQFASDELRMNFLKGKMSDLSTYLIENFSFMGSTVLDMSNLDGIPSEVAVRLGRNAICVAENKDLSANITAKLSKNLD